MKYTREEIIAKGELETFRRLIQDVYPAGVVSIVSDTWDFFKVVTEYAQELKPIIMERKPDSIGLAKVVFRPDSGDPVDILCGIEVREYTAPKTFAGFVECVRDDARDIAANSAPHGEHGDDEVVQYVKFRGEVYQAVAEIEWNRHDKQYYYVDGIVKFAIEKVTLTPEQKGAVECLWDVFGGTVTDKGFKVLDSHVGLIYGDSITPERTIQIMERLMAKGFASCNTVLGIGSYTYQYDTRDTLGLAMKATFGIVNGEMRNICKAPKTDTGKKSATGLLRVVKENGRLVLQERQPYEGYDGGELQVIVEDGRFVGEYVGIAEIRERIAESI